VRIEVFLDEAYAYCGWLGFRVSDNTLHRGDIQETASIVSSFRNANGHIQPGIPGFIVAYDIRCRVIIPAKPGISGGDAGYCGGVSGPWKKQVDEVTVLRAVRTVYVVNFKDRLAAVLVCGGENRSIVLEELISHFR